MHFSQGSFILLPYYAIVPLYFFSFPHLTFRTNPTPRTSPRNGTHNGTHNRTRNRPRTSPHTSPRTSPHTWIVSSNRGNTSLSCEIIIMHSFLFRSSSITSSNSDFNSTSTAFVGSSNTKINPSFITPLTTL